MQACQGVPNGRVEGDTDRFAMPVQLALALGQTRNSQFNFFFFEWHLQYHCGTKVQHLRRVYPFQIRDYHEALNISEGGESLHMCEQWQDFGSLGAMAPYQQYVRWRHNNRFAVQHVARQNFNRMSPMQPGLPYDAFGRIEVENGNAATAALPQIGGSGSECFGAFAKA